MSDILHDSLVSPEEQSRNKQVCWVGRRGATIENIEIRLPGCLDGLCEQLLLQELLSLVVVTHALLA